MQVIAAWVPTYITVKLLSPQFKRRMSWNKFNFPVGVILYAGYLNSILHIRIPRSLHTQIFTDQTERGKYVREVCRTKNPYVWKSISKQMYDLGYQFPEMNEVVSGQFPTYFVSEYQGSNVLASELK